MEHSNNIIGKEVHSAFNRLDLQHHKVALPFSQGYIFVKSIDIIYCEGNGGYTNFYLTDGRKICACKNIKEYDLQLHHLTFIRTHKSYLINLNHVVKLINEGYIVVTGEKKIPISRRKKTEILGQLKGQTSLVE